MFVVIALYLCDGCEQVEMEVETVERTPLARFVRSTRKWPIFLWNRNKKKCIYFLCDVIDFFLQSWKEILQGKEMKN